MSNRIPHEHCVSALFPVGAWARRLDSVCGVIANLPQSEGPWASQIPDQNSAQLAVIAGPQVFPIAATAIALSRLQMNLPQELLDEILSYLPSEDRQGQQSLASCSLVSKSWTNPSRRHLFNAANIREKSLQSWRDTISPANHELLQHIRALSYVTDAKGLPSNYPLEYRIDILQDYLPSLHRLQRLSLFSMRISSEISPKLEILSAFQYTLSQLSLDHCDVTISALVALINYFPNLAHLDLAFLFHVADRNPTPSLSRPRMSRLCLSGVRTNTLRILDQLSELGLAFDEVVVKSRRSVLLHALTRIANTVGKKVKCLKLQVPKICMYACLRIHRKSHRVGCRFPGREVVCTALSLPRAPGARARLDDSLRRGSGNHFFHHFPEHPKGFSRVPVDGYGLRLAQCSLEGL